MTLKASSTQQRILAAAVELFSKQGYNGASTRDVASRASVNEVTVYRNYANKKALFSAALESELSKISFSADSLAVLAKASDAHEALQGFFGLIADMTSRRPDMVRLLQFAALEMGDDLEPICRKHLDRLLDISTVYLKQWISDKESPFGDPRVLILAFISTVAGVGSFYRVLWGEDDSVSKDKQASICADIWSTALIGRES